MLSVSLFQRMFFNFKLDFTVKSIQLFLPVNQTKPVFQDSSLSELIGASISSAHFHPHPQPTTHHPSRTIISPLLLLLPASGCFKMSGKWAIKQNGDEAPRRVLVLRKPLLSAPSPDPHSPGARRLTAGRSFGIIPVGASAVRSVFGSLSSGICWILARSEPRCARSAARGYMRERPRG